MLSCCWPVYRPHECDHCEDRGDPEAGPGGSWAPVQIEADPWHDHDQAGGDVDLDEVVSHGPGEHDVHTQAGVVTRGQDLQHSPLPVAHNVKLRKRDLRIHFYWVFVVPKVN